MFSHRFAIAPMLDWTNRHCRYFHRLLSRRAVLYTEMITAAALIYGSRQDLLIFDSSEQPLALQLGGSDPFQLGECAKSAQNYGYNEINLNVGCPSTRVQAGRFGACLMLEPELVAECVATMQAKVQIPVTVKTRIGVDQADEYEQLCDFIETVSQAGCKTFIIHARKAWLKGLSPKENREIPPLRYEVVRQIKHDFPNLEIIINGGITDLGQARMHLDDVDGVMMGRSAYHNPYLLAEVDQQFYGATYSIPTRDEVLQQYLLYVEKELNSGTALHALVNPILGLFMAQPRARIWRRYLSENIHRRGAGINVINQAWQLLKID